MFESDSLSIGFETNGSLYNPSFPVLVSLEFVLFDYSFSGDPALPQYGNLLLAVFNFMSEGLSLITISSTISYFFLSSYFGVIR